MVSTEYCLIQVPNCPVPRCPGQYRNVQYRDVQVSTEMSRYRVVQVPRCLGFIIRSRPFNLKGLWFLSHSHWVRIIFHEHKKYYHMYHNVPQNYLFSEFNFYLLFVLLIFDTESAIRFMTSTCILLYLANTCEMITQIKIEVYTKKFRISLNLAIINFWDLLLIIMKIKKNIDFRL